MITRSPLLTPNFLSPPAKRDTKSSISRKVKVRTVLVTGLS